MPRSFQDFTPSWDMGDEVEARGPDLAPPVVPSEVTEEQVRDWLLAHGINPQNIDRIMSNATKAHGGGKAGPDPGTPPSAPSPDKVEGEDEEFPQMAPQTKSGPKPLFRGDRAGQ